MRKISKAAHLAYQFTIAIASVIFAFGLGGCTLPFVGVELRFSGENSVQTAQDLQIIGSDQMFERETITDEMSKHGFLFGMTKKVAQRKLAYTARFEGNDIVVSVGRLGGIGNRLCSDEITEIQVIVSKLRASPKFERVDREAGME